MGKYFGTDGFRGEANKNLTADHAYKIGRFLGWYYTELRNREHLTARNSTIKSIRKYHRCLKAWEARQDKGRNNKRK